MVLSLEELSSAPREKAFDALLSCCGSTKWAMMMVEARPFANLESLHEIAEKIWWQLRPGDWLEAFASHPKIGEHKAEHQASEQSLRWSASEQAGVSSAAQEILSALAEANQAYQERFGYIFIVCATGKSSEEMLELCQERLMNDHETEI
ncbi:MAG TPA: 2-oxo-4-hydroxy-4-carboxy-5-ureidoimidazoline decarboxylase, partial [Blastocatellia bacterium]|nr:2-oxo-4-hydroxy-4-carboxy-5-ureidoimidazoline decarboxylase [Blastocatellia bacterium]